MEEPFVLNNDTILRGLLAHIQAMVRKRATLVHEFTEHPDFKGDHPPRAVALRETWEILERDIAKVLGVHLVPFNELAKAGTFVQGPSTQSGSKDELRITMRVLKQRADKARLKDPTITLMKSWDLKVKEAEKDEG